MQQWFEMRTIEMSPEDIQDELRSLREAGERAAATRESARAFLKRIGADQLPSRAFATNGARRPAKKRK